MCVAIYKPQHMVLTKNVLAQCFTANPHGAGFAYLDKNKNAKIVKGLFSFKQFWKAYRDYNNREAIIHFRWSTHGAMDPQGMKENCHPFEIPNGALIHNGIISWACPTVHDRRSDTRVFTEDLLVPLLKDGRHPLDLKPEIEKSLGWNKVVMFYEGKPVIYNEAQGVWSNGIWFSNTSWKRYSYHRKGTGTVYVPTFPSPRTYAWEDPLFDRQLEDAYDRYVNRIDQSLTVNEVLENLDREEDEIYTCDLCKATVQYEYQLIGLGSQDVCIPCWQNYSSWKTELDAYDRLNKLPLYAQEA